MIIGQRVTNLTQLITRNHSDLQSIGANDHHNQAHGDSDHSGVSRRIFIPCTNFFSDGAYSTNNRPPYIGFQNSQVRMACTSLQIPEGYVSGLSFKGAFWTASSTGNLYWRLLGQWRGDTENIVTHSTSPAYGTSAIGAAATLYLFSPPNAPDFSGLVAGDILDIAVDRNALDATDTVENTVLFLGVQMNYTGKY